MAKVGDPAMVSLHTSSFSLTGGVRHHWHFVLCVVAKVARTGKPRAFIRIDDPQCVPLFDATVHPSGRNAARIWSHSCSDIRLGNRANVNMHALHLHCMQHGPSFTTAEEAVTTLRKFITPNYSTEVQS